MYSRKLSFDNCEEGMIREAVQRYEEGEDSYERWYERRNLEIQVESEIKNKCFQR